MVPDDPEFRSALVGYIEWGSRLAVLNSKPRETVPENSPMPRWGWGSDGRTVSSLTDAAAARMNGLAKTT
jgi:hypothetical protein